MRVGRTTDTFGANAVVDRLGKTCVFDKSRALAGVIGESFADASGLYAAVVHLENQRAVFPLAGLAIQPPIHAEV